MCVRETYQDVMKKDGGQIKGSHSLVDKVDSLGFELIGTVQVSQNQDLGSVLHGQTRT